MATLPECSRSVKLANGSLMPLLGLGTYSSDNADRCYHACVTALKSGYRLLDCAWAYGNEREVRRAVEDCMSDGTVTRKDVFVINKLWHTMHHPDDVYAACDRSLKAMGLQYFDLYLIHAPFALAKPDDINAEYKLDEKGNKVPADVPITDTWKAMEKLVDLGLCKAIGVSNFNIDQMERIRAIAKHPIANNQVEVNLYQSQVELVDWCTQQNISVTGFSPLYAPGRGWKKEGDPVPLFDNGKVIDIGGKYGKSPAQVMLRFQLQRGVAVIPKSYTPSRIKHNIDVFDFELSDNDMKTLYDFNINHHSVAGADDFVGMESHPEFPW